jgi:hypothetical protein
MGSVRYMFPAVVLAKSGIHLFSFSVEQMSIGRHSRARMAMICQNISREDLHIRLHAILTFLMIPRRSFRPRHHPATDSVGHHDHFQAPEFHQKPSKPFIGQRLSRISASWSPGSHVLQPRKVPVLHVIENFSRFYRPALLSITFQALGDSCCSDRPWAAISRAA